MDERRMSEVYGDDGWNDLHPKDYDMDVFVRDVVLCECVDLDCSVEDKIQSYDGERHAQLEKKGVWRGVPWCGLPYPLGVAVSFYLHILGDTARLVEDVLHKMDLDKLVHRKTYTSRTSMLSDWVKRRGPSLTSEWRAIIDLNYLVGFNLDGPGTKEQQRIINEWCGGVLLRQSMTNINVCETIVRNMRVGPHVGEWLTLAEFLAQPDLWVTKGSGKGVKAQLVDTQTGGMVMSTSNKTSVALTMSVDDMLRELFSGCSEVFTISNKVEVAGKGRIIISPGWQFNLLMTYVLYYYEKCARRKRSDSPLWQNGTQRVAMWSDMVRSVKSGDWLYPQDVSKFDQTLATDEFDALLDGVTKWITSVGSVQFRAELRRAWSEVVRRWRSARVTAGKGTPTVKWEHGMPSGIRLTALGDTFVSLSRTWAIVRNKKSEIRWMYGMGDDILIAGRKPYFVMDVFLSTNEMGVTVNAAKNFASTKHAEFLRIAVDAQTACGYPARHVIKHMFREPGAASFDFRNLMSVSNFVASCNMFRSRMCDKDVVEKYAIETLERECVSGAVRALYTPRASGGLGFMRTAGEQVKLKQDEVKPRYVATTTGCFTTITNNTLAMGVDSEAVMSQLALRVSRGLPPPQPTDVHTESVVTTAPDPKLYEQVMQSLGAKRTTSARMPIYEFETRVTGLVFDDLVLSRLIRDKEWDEIVRLASPRCKEFTKHVMGKWQRAAFLMWLRNDLPVPSPMVPGWSETAIADCVDRVLGLAHSRLMRMHRVSLIHIHTMFVTIELAVRDYCESVCYKFAY